METFTNKIGQTFEPGEEVIAITTCTGRVQAVRATFLGFKKSYVYIERLVMKYPWDKGGRREIMQKSRLLYNRIYKLDTPIEQLAGVYFNG